MHATVLGLGEAGAVYASGLAAHGWTVTGYDPASVPTPVGVRREAGPADAVRGADLVLSLVGGRHAQSAAEAVAPHLDESAVYADMNAGDPAAKILIADAVGAGRFADVSVIGPVPRHGIATSVVISGAGATAAAGRFRSFGAEVDDIGGAPGDASARKLLRTTWMKGLGALITEALRAGRAAGAEEWVARQIDGELADGTATRERLHIGTAKHAARRAGESDAAVHLLDQLGVAPGMTRATAQLHHTLADEQLVDQKALLDTYRGLAVATIGDAQDRMGMMDGGIHALYKGARAVGRARTVWVRSGDNAAIHRALQNVRRGDLIVVNGHGDTTRALIGELIAERALVRGVTGMVIDGAARDVVELERIGFPVWARATTPAGPFKHGPGRIDEPVAVGGVVVQPGDVVAADDDGVIVVPAARAAATAVRAQEVTADEERRRSAIRAGAA